MTLTTQTEFPAWLPLTFMGAEGDDDNSQGSDADAGDNKSGDSTDDKSKTAGDSSDGSQGSDDDSTDHDDADDPKTKGLSSALRKERQERQKLERELKKLNKAKEDEDLAKKSEAEQAKIRADKAEERATKLATGFRNTAVNAAIREAARDANFIDVEDALAGVDRESITIEQDDDDPSQIDLDLRTVKTAVKALASKKPHFIRSGSGDSQSTGSQFGGKGKGKGTTSEEQLKQKYSGL